MKEEDKRAVALNSLTSIGKEYVTLSDSTTIGKDVLKDLKKLMELELREKYKVNKTKWRVLTPTFKEDKVTISEYYDKITNELLITKLQEKYNENKKKITEKEDTIKELKNDNKADTYKYKKLKKELKELQKYFVIDMVTDEPIYFNTIAELGGSSYCAPYIELNKDPKEIATILNDKKELDKIFREKQFKSFDDMVILDFYNEITKKLSDTKDYLRKTDPDIRQDIIDDLYNKLFALYDIKEYYFKDKVKEKDDIKEKYIKEKIRKNNNLSIGGGDYTDVNDELAGGALEVSNMIYNGLKENPNDNMVKKVGKKIGKKIAPVIALPVETAAKVGIGALKGVGTGIKKAAVGTFKGMRATAKAVDKLTDIPSNVGKYVVDKVKERERLNKKKAEKFLEADKFFHIVTNLKDKSVDEIDNALNIKTLKELSDVLNDNSIYKKNIEELIDIHDSLLSSNRDTLLAEQEQEADEYIKKKKEASGEFVLEAVQKYKDLKKSFVDKVNKDKDDIEKMLEEGAGDDFAEEISFDNIITNNSGTYIKKLKKLNSFLYMLNKKGGKYMDGGAAPMYDVQKLKKDDGDQESSGNTPFDYYRKLKDIYIDIVNQYYKLIDQIGEEENHYKFIYQYESLGIKDNDATKTAPINPEDTQSKKNLIEAYKLIYEKLQQAKQEDETNRRNANIFVNDGDSGYPKTSVVMTKLLEDIGEPEKKSLIAYKKEFHNSNNYSEKWRRFSKPTSTSALFDKLNASIDIIDSTCSDIDNCDNILSTVKNIFKDTSTIG